MHLIESALGQFPVLELSDPDSGAFVSALPTRGGTVHRLGLVAPDGNVREVMMPMRTEREVERHRWSKGAMLAPWPNRIREARYAFEGTTYQPVKNFKPQGGHAIHGTVCFETFRLLGRKATDPSFRLSLDSKGWTGYPFPVRITFGYHLGHDGLTLEFSLENRGKSRIPAGLGWHPYFRLGDSVKPCLLTVPDGKKLSMTERAVPDGRKAPLGRFAKPEAIGEDFLDACLELAGKGKIQTSRLVDPSSGLALEVWQETGPGKFNYLQLFTHPLRHCLALEPMTCAPDAFNNGMGLAVLEPGETLSASCGVRLASA
ncbi:MAG TPA: hypothetical protein PKO15_03370 [Fibrobacteria bacterium]|mgnify:CR=1 FL=1|nr:hypothetical protein [Fibrobacteria bacterium]HOX49964.1 hypothetical protein [Fibrobacteria bacterium]